MTLTVRLYRVREELQNCGEFLLLTNKGARTAVGACQPPGSAYTRCHSVMSENDSMWHFAKLTNENTKQSQPHIPHPLALATATVPRAHGERPQVSPPDKEDNINNYRLNVPVRPALAVRVEELPVLHLVVMIRRNWRQHR